MGITDRFSRPPSKDKFAKLTLDRIQKAGEREPVNYDREGFRLVKEGGHVAFLANAYQDYCSARASQREQVLQRYVRAWFSHLRELPQEFADVRPDLLPTVRARSLFELTRLQAEVEGGTAVSSPYQILGEHFGVGLIYDMPDSMRMIRQNDLEQWGVTFYEALEVARQNLMEMKAVFIGPKEGEGVYLSNTKDSYDSSRLILLDLIRRFQVKGDYIALVPNRETLIVAGSEDVAGLKGMVALAEEGLKAPRPIHGIALRLNGDDWVPWPPDASHSLYGEFKTMQVQSLGQDYAEQKALLDQLHTKTGEDVFVASYSSFEKKGTGVVRSYAVWAAGVTDTLLPEVDVIGFMPNQGEPTLVEWDEAVRFVGEAMEPQEMYPVRYRVTTGFPSAEQLRRMASVPL